MIPPPPPPDATGLPGREPRKSRRELLKSVEVPQHQRQPFILCGYRQTPAGPCGLLRTIFTLHNETGNMWTHLLGSFYVLGIGVDLVGGLDQEAHGALGADAMWVLALCGTTAACLLASFSYHLCCCTERRVCECMHKMDQTGIVALIIMSYFSGIALGYRCFPGIRILYLCLAGCVAVALALPLAFRRLVTNVPRHLTLCCVAGVVPAGHWVCIASSANLQLALPYLVTMFGCYGGGVWIYFAQWPECRWPGRFDIFGHSHQLWHLFVLGAAVTWVRGNVRLLLDLECDSP